MTEKFDKATRSRMMAGIKSKNTKPETIIRKGLHAIGFRYSLHAKNLPGKPDIVMPKWHVVIFVHGCFWHKHGCFLSKIPASNTEFWNSKLSKNQLRDQLVKQKLADTGWRIATIWECATRGKDARNHFPNLLDKLALWIRDPKNTPAIEITAISLLVSSGQSDDINKTL